MPFSSESDALSPITGYIDCHFRLHYLSMNFRYNSRFWGSVDPGHKAVIKRSRNEATRHDPSQQGRIQDFYL